MEHRNEKNVLQRGCKSSFATVLTCTTSRLIPVIAKTDQTPEGGDLIPLGCRHVWCIATKRPSFRVAGVGSTGPQIVLCNCLDLHHTPPDSGDCQCRSNTWRRRFDPAWVQACVVYRDEKAVPESRPRPPGRVQKVCPSFLLSKNQNSLLELVKA